MEARVNKIKLDVFTIDKIISLGTAKGKKCKDALCSNEIPCLSSYVTEGRKEKRRGRDSRITMMENEYDGGVGMRAKGKAHYR